MALPTMVPTGPMKLPRTAPVAAPANGFGIGGISMFSFESCRSLGGGAFSLASSGISVSEFYNYIASLNPDRRFAPAEIFRGK
jgi:hypothetical protein